MKKAVKGKRDPEMLDEYDFSKGVRGKYAKRYAEGTNVVVLAPDVAAMFPDAASVNAAWLDCAMWRNRSCDPAVRIW